MSRIKFKGQHLMNFCMAAISAYVVLTAIRWPFKTALFPVVIGCCVFGMSFAEFVMAIYEDQNPAKKKKKKDVMDFQLSQDVDPAVATRRTLSAFAWIIGFFILIYLFSFNVGIALYVFLYVKLQGKEKWPISIFMAFASWGFFWGLFIWLLDTPMPEGAFFSMLRSFGIGS